jgi:XTP/dITP diphosphohydrolase
VRQILIATHNKGKLAEFGSLLAPYDISVLSSGDLGLPAPEETGASFAENAQLKARAAAKAANLPALADDSGISIAALANGPSARYAAGDYPAAFQRIIAAAAQKNEWRARFTCALCLAQPDGKTATYIGHAEGAIAKIPSGAKGFGYDPIFVPLGYGETYAELGGEVKDKISHRARAFEQFLSALAVLYPGQAISAS